MESYAAVLAVAIPGFVLLIIIESLVAHWRGMQVNRPLDTISSLSSGMTNTLTTLMGSSVVAPIHFFSQFSYHSRLIKRMGFLEYFWVTHAHHRVHHAINDEYLDKNFSEIFIIWDKLFGTFQEELPDVPPVYGTKRPAKTWNPIIINFQHLWSIVQDAWRTRSWWDKLRIWFMPTGWRPADVATRYPIPYYKHAAEQVKYQTPYTRGLQYWSWTQLVINLGLMYHLMFRIGHLSLPEIMLYGGFLFLSVFAYSALMDGHWLALPFELVKLVYALVIIYT